MLEIVDLFFYLFGDFGKFRYESGWNVRFMRIDLYEKIGSEGWDFWEGDFYVIFWFCSCVSKFFLLFVF